MSYPSEVVLQNVAPFMSIPYILSVFGRYGERPIFANFANGPMGLPVCIIQFANDDIAKHVVTKLNGKPIPDAFPMHMVLNLIQGGSNPNAPPGHDIWVGDLSPDVDDFALFSYFLSFYVTIRYAKVITDASGKSKGYGFIRLMDTNEQEHCLSSLNGAVGLGCKPLRINKAVMTKTDTDNSKQLKKENRSDPTETSEKGSRKVRAPRRTKRHTFFKVYMRWNELGFGKKSKKDFLATMFPFHVQNKNGFIHRNDYKDARTIKNINTQSIQRSSLLWDCMEHSKWLPVNSLMYPRNTTYVFNSKSK